MNHPRQPGELLLDPADFVIGDMLVGREVGDWEVGSDFIGWRFEGDGKFKLNADPRGEPYTGNFAGGGRYRVVRPGRDQVGPFSFAKPAQADSRWNGRCGRCGQGTYTGFTSVEHEGGECG